MEQVLHDVPGVQRARVNLATSLATVDLSDRAVTPTQLIEAVRRAGYDGERIRPGSEAESGLERTQDAQIQAHGQALVHAFGLALPIMAVHWLAHSLQGHDAESHVWPLAIQAILSLCLLLSAAGAPILAGGFRALVHLSPNMDLLVSLGVCAAFLSGVATLLGARIDGAHMHAAAMILLFINVGRYLEGRARKNAAAAIASLVRRVPRTVQMVGEDGIKSVRLERVRRGDRIRVAQDTVVPVDGRIADGAASIDESSVTGESVPRYYQSGEDVRAGGVVREGLITIEATRVGEESTMGRIIRAVEEAQAGKTKLQRLADRVAGVFVPLVVVFALASFAISWTAGTPALEAINRTIAVLVIACPCAMGLATPMAVLVATGRAALDGILVRDAASLEAAGFVNVVLLDKTGTLTTGAPSVKEVYGASIGPVTRDAKQVLAIAASAEQFSQHPFARAILSKAAELGLSLVEPGSFSNHGGLGVEATIDGRIVRVGHEKLMKNAGIDGAAVRERAAQMANDGQSVVWLSVDRECAGVISVTDELRPGAQNAVDRLSELGVSTAILTGDHARTAAAVAASVGIRDVRAEMSPQEKLADVASRQKRGQCVAFVGDGVNDAPALAAADVGITFTTATDVAVGAADVAILHEDLSRIPAAIQLARRTRRIIKQNLFWAFFYNVIALPLAATGHILPGIAAAAMMCSSLSVVLNSLRLRR